jgi:NADPH:quinone reductase-like Zn-dependent oxidoreductase
MDDITTITRRPATAHLPIGAGSRQPAPGRTITTEAWVLRRPDADRPPTFTLGAFTFPDIAPDEILASPLYGCWEGNMEHAITGSPMDLCRQRGEAAIVLGNAGVVRVLRCGDAVTHVLPGDLCMVFCAGELDESGHPRTIMGFDCPGSMGVLAHEAKYRAHQLIPLSENSRLAPRQWAAFSLRYVTAWSNWVSASQVWRVQMDDAFPHRCDVIGWGGGVSYAELDLARREGCQATLITANPTHEAAMGRLGVGVVHRDRSGGDDARILAALRERTQDRGVSIFIDNIGANFRLTLRSLARQGVVTTCGWREGMTFPLQRAAECIARHVHVFTHYAPPRHGAEAVAYAERTGWGPDVASTPTPWEDIGRLAEAYTAGEVSDYFPTFAING